MRKLVPYLGIAAAVAVGLALAPFAWAIVCVASIAGLLALSWRRRARVLVFGRALFAAAVLAWPIALWRLGSHADAVFVVACLGALAAWEPMKRRCALV